MLVHRAFYHFLLERSLGRSPGFHYIISFYINNNTCEVVSLKKNGLSGSLVKGEGVEFRKLHNWILVILTDKASLMCFQPTKDYHGVDKGGDKLNVILNVIWSCRLNGRSFFSYWQNVPQWMKRNRFAVSVNGTAVEMVNRLNSKGLGERWGLVLFFLWVILEWH